MTYIGASAYLRICLFVGYRLRLMRYGYLGGTRVFSINAISLLSNLPEHAFENAHWLDFFVDKCVEDTAVAKHQGPRTKTDKLFEFAGHINN